MTDIQTLASKIMALINSKPRSPTQAEIEGVIREATKDQAEPIYVYSGGTIATIMGNTP
jgi:hypothetical protein